MIPSKDIQSLIGEGTAHRKAMPLNEDNEMMQMLIEGLQRCLPDVERIDWLADKRQFVGNVELPTQAVINNLDSLRGAIDEAREIES